jgi:hypothetical protein
MVVIFASDRESGSDSTPKDRWCLCLHDTKIFVLKTKFWNSRIEPDCFYFSELTVLLSLRQTAQCGRENTSFGNSIGLEF